MVRRPSSDPSGASGGYDSRGLANQNPGGLGFWELLREDYGAHGALSPGFRAIAVHRFGNWRMDVRSRPLRLPLDLLYRWMNRRVVRRHGIQLEYGAEIGRRVVIDHQNGILVQRLCRIGEGTRLRHNVTIGVRQPGDGGRPVLGHRVDVGVGAVILGDVHIGDDAVIGANAVVIDDVPAGSLAVGIPARVVRRSDPTPPIGAAASGASPVPSASALPSASAVPSASAESSAPTGSDGVGTRDDSGEFAVVDVR